MDVTSASRRHSVDIVKASEKMLAPMVLTKSAEHGHQGIALLSPFSLTDLVCRALIVLPKKEDGLPKNCSTNGKIESPPSVERKPFHIDTRNEVESADAIHR